jgi:hypothetical protein
MCLQCYYGETQQILALFINLYCLKSCHNPDYSVRIIEYYREKLLSLNPTSSPRLEPRTVFRFVILVFVIFSLKQTLVLLPFFYHAYF